MTDDQGFIPVSKAANILACTKRRVHELCDQGLIRRTHSGDDVFVHSEDVAQLRMLDIVGEIRPGDMVRRILMLENQVHRNSCAINTLDAALELKRGSFHKFDEEQLLTLFALCNDIVGDEAWDLDKIDEFSTAFIQLTEVDIDRLNEVFTIDNAWLPFYQVCVHMAKYVMTHPKLDSNLALQRVHTKLGLARQNLSVIALFFVERAGLLTPTRKLLSKLASVDMDAFEALARTMKNRGNLKLTR